MENQLVNKDSAALQIKRPAPRTKGSFFRKTQAIIYYKYDRLPLVTKLGFLLVSLLQK